MPETTIACIDCGTTFTMSEGEKLYFEELIRTLPNFRMPRRCAECRKKRKIIQGGTPLQGMPGTYQGAQGNGGGQCGPGPAVAPLPLPSSLPVVVEEPPKEVRVILVGHDFADLVCGRPVVRPGVRVILADIGVDVMRKAVDRAVIEKALAMIV